VILDGQRVEERFYWFGVRLFINAGHVGWGCDVGVNLLADFVGKITGVGWIVARRVAIAVATRFCHNIAHGLMIDFYLSGGYIAIGRQ